MPGVLIVEAMAQAGAVMMLSGVPDRHGKLIYFTGIDKCRFRRPVVPGDQLLLEGAARTPPGPLRGHARHRTGRGGDRRRS